MAHDPVRIVDALSPIRPAGAYQFAILRKRLDSLEGRVRSASELLLDEIDDASEDLRACLSELEAILTQPAPNASALTSVRLKLARVRLTRGPLLGKVVRALGDQITASDKLLLQQLQLDHQGLMLYASAHTTRWTLDEIARDWPEYRSDTRELAQRWLTKTELEKQVLCPILRITLSRHGERGSGAVVGSDIR